MRRFPAPAFPGLCLAVTLGWFAAAAPTPSPAQEVKPVEPPPEFNPATEPAVVAVAKVLPAVVNISSERTIRRTIVDPLEQFYEEFFNAPTNRQPARIAAENPEPRLGFPRRR